jgi:RND family efflux transporter MFP subunit
MTGLGVVALTILLTIGIAPRIARGREAANATGESLVNHPAVTVIRPVNSGPTSELLLPGNIEPLYTAALYARTDGYLQHRSVDIGSRVHAGQAIAKIASPEVDQQLSQTQAMVEQAAGTLKQAQAALQQAKANVELARLTKERDLPLGAQHAISQQIVDEAVQTYNARLADVTAAEANIVAASANVTASRANASRLQQLHDFETIVAPFDGTITERNVEQGDLITTGNSAKPLFRVSQSGTLRIWVDVPQSEAINITNGETACITLKERLGRTYTGKVVRNANSLDDAARTMRVEVQLDNRDGSLLPGMYADVRFVLPQQHPVLTIPTSSLIVDQNGTRVAVVRGRKVHFLSVVIGRDEGAEIEILDGIGADDVLVASPSDLLVEGQEVKVI